MDQAIVLDALGRTLSPCAADRARKLVQAGRATVVATEPLTIQLGQAVERPAPTPVPAVEPLRGQRLLLHICCGPCATYTVSHLYALGAEVTGHWFNPNVHPYSEHELRRESLERYAAAIALPMLWEPGYEMPAFLRAVAGHEATDERCRLCYALRLARTAQRAADGGMDAFGTTLLISPYQDIEAIRQIGEELAGRYGVAFYYENMRRGFAAHQRLAREHALYQQRYCGCVYSEWESLDREAPTDARRT